MSDATSSTERDASEAVSFKYDVGFSFLAADEGIANELNDLVADRLSTFLYSERQKELAGTDGEETLNRVFSKECRVVVALYRSGWGTTAWTRIEETAIRNRAHDEGYDFCIFVALEERPQMPRWLPRNRIWVGYQRWGARGAAAVIEQRVAELGGKARAETMEEFAARTARNADFEARHKAALSVWNLNQIVAAAAADTAVELETLVAKFNAAQSSIKIELLPKGAGHFPVLGGLPDGLSFNFHMVYSNTLDHTAFRARIWDGPAPRPGIWYNEPKVRLEKVVGFDYSRADKYVWVMDGRQLGAAEFAKALLEWYVDNAQPRGEPPIAGRARRPI